MNTLDISLKFIFLSIIVPVVWAFLGHLMDYTVAKFETLHWLLVTIVAAFLTPIFILEGIKALISTITFLGIGIPLRYFIEKKK